MVAWLQLKCNDLQSFNGFLNCSVELFRVFFSFAAFLFGFISEGFTGKNDGNETPQNATVCLLSLFMSTTTFLFP